MAAERINRGVWMIEKMNGRVDDFSQVVRRNVGRHTNRNTCRTIEKQVRHLCRQHHRLIEAAIKVRLPIHRTLTQLS